MRPLDPKNKVLMIHEEVTGLILNFWTKEKQ